MKLLQIVRKNKIWVLLALQMILATHAIAESGLHYTRTLTFADLDPTTSPSIVFEVPNGLPAGRITEIIVELGADDGASSLPDPITSSVAFNLSLGSESTGSVVAPTPSASPITCTTSPGACVPNKTIIVNRDTSTLAYLKYIYTIIILHDNGTPALENWSVGITSLPTSAVSPSTRINATAVGNATFTSLVPTGPSACAPCTGSTPNVYTTVSVPATGPFTFTATTVTENGDPLPPGTTIEAIAEGYAAVAGSVSSMPAGPGPHPAGPGLVVTYTPPPDPPCCNMVTFQFDVKDASGTLISQTRKTRQLNGSCGGVIHPPVVVGPGIIIGALCPEFPPIGPGPGPCPYGLSCPDDWMELPRDGYIRQLTRIRPLTEKGEVFGAGLGEQFDINITNGHLIGPKFDVGDASYLQMIEYRDGGDAPELGYSIGEFTSMSVAVGEVPLAEANRLQGRANIVTGLLAVSLIVNGILLFRRRFGKNHP